MYKKLIISIFLVLGLFGIFTNSAYAINPTDQSTWPIDVNATGVYYTYAHLGLPTNTGDCYNGGSSWGNCYVIRQYDTPMCDISIECDLIAYSSGGTPSLRLSWANITSFPNGHVIGSWFYNEDTDAWQSGGTMFTSNSTKQIDYRYPFYQSVWSNMGGWRYDSSATSDYDVADSFGLGDVLSPNQYAVSNGSQSCNVQALFTDQNPDDNGIFEAWWSFKLWFWNTFSPSCFLDLSLTNSLTDVYKTKAPFAYIYSLSSSDIFEPISEASSAGTLAFPVPSSLSGTGTITMDLGSSLNSGMTVLKTIFDVFLAIGFVAYLYNLMTRIEPDD